MNTEFVTFSGCIHQVQSSVELAVAQLCRTLEQCVLICMYIHEDQVYSGLLRIPQVSRCGSQLSHQEYIWNLIYFPPVSNI